jgi:hypothetical protein
MMNLPSHSAVETLNFIKHGCDQLGTGGEVKKDSRDGNPRLLGDFGVPRFA